MIFSSIILILCIIFGIIVGIVVTVATLEAFAKREYLLGILYSPFSVMMTMLGLIPFTLFTSMPFDNAFIGGFVIPSIVVIIYGLIHTSRNDINFNRHPHKTTVVKPQPTTHLYTPPKINFKTVSTQPRQIKRLENKADQLWKNNQLDEPTEEFWVVYDALITKMKKLKK